MNIIITFIASLLALALPFGLLLFSLKNPQKWKYVVGIVAYIIFALPMIIIVIDDSMHHYVDANIGLGLSFFFTWFVTIVVLIIGSILFIKNRII